MGPVFVVQGPPSGPVTGASGMVPLSLVLLGASGFVIPPSPVLVSSPPKPGDEQPRPTKHITANKPPSFIVWSSPCCICVTQECAQPRARIMKSATTTHMFSAERQLQSGHLIEQTSGVHFRRDSSLGDDFCRGIARGLVERRHGAVLCGLDAALHAGVEVARQEMRGGSRELCVAGLVLCDRTHGAANHRIGRMVGLPRGDERPVRLAHSLRRRSRAPRLPPFVCGTCERAAPWPFLRSDGRWPR